MPADRTRQIATAVTQWLQSARPLPGPVWADEQADDEFTVDLFPEPGRRHRLTFLALVRRGEPVLLAQLFTGEAAEVERQSRAWIQAQRSTAEPP